MDSHEGGNDNERLHTLAILPYSRPLRRHSLRPSGHSRESGNPYLIKAFIISS